MLDLQRSITFLLVAAALAEGNNLRQAYRTLQTFTPSDDYFSVMLDRVNQVRAVAGLPALCTNKKLQEAAQRHSDDQAANDYLDHKGTDGTSVSDRITQAGYDWNAVAENVAAGQPDVDSVMESWLKSPGHLENILGDYTTFGTAYSYNADGTYRHYWTQDFGSGDAEECNVKSIADTNIATVNDKTDEPVVAIDPSETGASTDNSHSGSKESDASFTGAPVVVESLDTQGDNVSGETGKPVMVIDPSEIEVSLGGSCSGSKETDAPYTW
ncbi:hypothetical protein KXD40_006760 [Peronospora effusa]|uniref:SCP domain-containing protein n=1 Tax=Peronospora effusa TaxID=542832 RepID=A0A425CLG5_9STRA|nr:hypothetical protein DD237_002404 [Peronospora effusa]UIZ24636.1 hypothetical protein KXD40_006760 [Peronospora effusa]CAI5718926.1 unnamed protein product [Peronospora effusa]